MVEKRRKGVVAALPGDGSRKEVGVGTPRADRAEARELLERRAERIMLPENESDLLSIAVRSRRGELGPRAEPASPGALTSMRPSLDGADCHGLSSLVSLASVLHSSSYCKRYIARRGTSGRDVGKLHNSGCASCAEAVMPRWSRAYLG